MKLLAVPNVSEGRDFERLDRLQDSLGVEVVLLDRHADIDHNRAVFTIAGPPGDVEKALTGRAADEKPDQQSRVLLYRCGWKQTTVRASKASRAVERTARISVGW